MGGSKAPVVANVTEAGDIVVFAIVLGVTLGVGLALLAIDSVVGRLRERGGRRGRRRPVDSPGDAGRRATGHGR